MIEILACAPENAAVYLSIEGSDPDACAAVGEPKNLCPAAIVFSPVPRLWLKSTGEAVVVVVALQLPPSAKSKLPPEEDETELLCLLSPFAVALRLPLSMASSLSTRSSNVTHFLLGGRGSAIISEEDSMVRMSASVSVLPTSA